MDEWDVYQTDEVATWLRELQDSDPKTTGSGGRHSVTSYTKWDRDAYIERVGGPEEAERRRKVLMARQSGQRLAEERKQHGLTQAQLAETMGVTSGRVSQIERGEVSTIEAIARYVQALGGHLELVANFADHTLTVTTTEGGARPARASGSRAELSMSARRTRTGSGSGPGAR